MPEAIHRLSALDLIERYRQGSLSPVEVVRTLLERIAEHRCLNAVSAVDAERSLAGAEDALQRYRAGRARPLEGVPVLVKDLIDTSRLTTTYGSAMFAGHVPEHDATVVRLLREAGAIVLGKTTTHEFAWGITTDGTAAGPARNPWNPDLVPGGSSGGSAAALAAGLAPLALGTDTAGSVRIPAAFCGVAGLRPTFGRCRRPGSSRSRRPWTPSARWHAPSTTWSCCCRSWRRTPSAVRRRGIGSRWWWVSGRAAPGSVRC
jgi:aspartyl-tRNA(Asn)/glutamyl-tRNA(Gln) amidotransferase subunit A